jgi:peptidoglycan/xylan/chitin deacetylase (PgdA/CDA1 family)
MTLGTLSIVVFATAHLCAVDRVFFQRLAEDPLLDLRAIVVEGARPREAWGRRLLRGVGTGGWRGLAFEIGSGLGVLMRTLVWKLFEAFHPRVEPPERWDTLARGSGIRIHRVADLDSDACVTLVRSLRPQVGVITGDRTVSDRVVSIPEQGTLTLRKGRCSNVGRVGYRELTMGESTLSVSVRLTTSESAASRALATASIDIEECDTLESLAIKADILGANLYYDTIRRFALGHHEGRPDDTVESPGNDDGATELDAARLERRLRARAAAIMPTMRERPSQATTGRLALQYVVLFPLLRYLRRRFARQSRSPIAIHFYHVVANRPVNHMCLPLEEFVRQIEFLRRYYPILPLDDAIARARSGRNEALAVAITFDDGYEDNAWAVEYLRYFGIPASFFVSIGHVLDGTAFEHDRRGGFHDAPPMTEKDVRRLSEGGFLIGSHGLHHEDFGQLSPSASEGVLRQSRDLIGDIAGRTPEHFAFPIGHRKRNITRANFELARTYYRYVYSADGGYNFPISGRTHFVRIGNPNNVLRLAMTMDGYTGFRSVLIGNAWGLKVDTVAPY